MAADTLKSLSITNLDATPIVPNATGAGAGGYVKDVSDFVTPSTAGLVNTGSTYRMVRLPTNAKLKALKLNADAHLDSSTGLVLDVGAYYSDATNDGTAQANQGAVISVNCFAAAIDFHTAFTEQNALVSFGAALRNEPLWKALGLASDPGGFIDVVVAVHTAATTAVSNPLQARAEYVE